MNEREVQSRGIVNPKACNTLRMHTLWCTTNPTVFKSRFIFGAMSLGRSLLHWATNLLLLCWTFIHIDSKPRSVTPYRPLGLTCRAQPSRSTCVPGRQARHVQRADSGESSLSSCSCSSTMPLFDRGISSLIHPQTRIVAPPDQASVSETELLRQI
jgi:hypothetical protein